MSLVRFAGSVALLSFLPVLAQNSLTGTVQMADGTPVVGVEVVVQDTMNYEMTSTLTDNVGAYSVALPSSLTKCNIMIRINSMMSVPTPGIPRELYHTAFTKVPLSGSTTKDVTLPYFGHIHGKVVDEDGAGVAGASLVVKKWNGFEASPVDYTTSGSDGNYDMYEESGGIKIWVTAPAGYTSIEPEFTITGDTLIDLVLPKPIMVHGMVQSHDGAPAENTIVCLQWGYNQVDSLVHADGSYSIPVQPGTYLVRLRSNSMNPVANAPVEFDTTVISELVVTGDTALDLTLQRFYCVDLTVLDNDGGAVSAAEIRSVRGTGIGQLPRDMGTTNAEGKDTIYVGAGNCDYW